MLIFRHYMPVLRSVRWTLVLRFLLRILFYKSFSRRLPCGRVFPFPRTLLHNLLAVAHPEIVSVLPQLSSQRLNWYYQFYYHSFSFL